MDDRALLRTVLIVAVLSLAVNAYTLYEVRAQAAAQEAPPANLFGNLICPKTCMRQCGGDTKCYDACVCRCSGPGAACFLNKNNCYNYQDGTHDWKCVKDCEDRACPVA